MESLTIAIFVDLPSLARTVKEDACALIVGTPHATGEFHGTDRTEADTGVLHVAHALELAPRERDILELEEKLGYA